ncbi:Ribosomal protein L22p/L17e family protein [Perilla frutescens var. frutescens]|nr:Ribosomal protein L22p/L17e family protein [Perilla frutescens var. frutescens]
MNGVPALRSVLSIKRRLLSYLELTSSKNFLAAEGTPISSPLILALPSSTGSSETQEAICKSSKVQAVLKGIKQNPKKLNLVAALVRGMRVEDALLQLQVTVKRAAKTVYQTMRAPPGRHGRRRWIVRYYYPVEHAFNPTLYQITLPMLSTFSIRPEETAIPI